MGLTPWGSRAYEKEYAQGPDFLQEFFLELWSGAKSVDKNKKSRTWENAVKVFVVLTLRRARSSMSGAAPDGRLGGLFSLVPLLPHSLLNHPLQLLSQPLQHAVLGGINGGRR